MDLVKAFGVVTLFRIKIRHNNITKDTGIVTLWLTATTTIHSHA
jgi:hypothetical protein